LINFKLIVTDRVSTGGNAIAYVTLSVGLSVRFHSLSNRLTFGLDLLHVCRSLPRLTEIETEGHIQVKVKTRSV